MVNINDSIHNHTAILFIPPEILLDICARLTIPSLLQFERVKKWDPETKKIIWLCERKERDLSFDWSFLEQDEQKDKFTCLLNSALKTYILEDRLMITRASERWHFKNDASARKEQQELASKVEQKWKGLMKRFPLFQAYIRQDLYFLKHFKNLEKTDLLKEQKSILEQKASENKWGGDLLLRGLWKVNTLGKDINKIDKKMAIICSCCQQAIENKATIASVLVFKSIEIFKGFNSSVAHHTSSYKTLCRLAVAAAEKGDYRGEEFCIESGYFPKFLCGSNLSCLPSAKSLTLRDRLLELHKFGEKENLTWQMLECDYQELLNQYGEQAPLRVLVRAAYVKKKLGAWREANDLYERAIAIYDDKIIGYHDVGCDIAPPLPRLLLDAISIKKKMGLWEEITSLYAKLLFSDRRNLGFEGDKALLGAARITIHLHLWEEANELLTQLLDKKANLSCLALMQIAEVKCHLHLFQEADKFYKRFWDACKKNSNMMEKNLDHYLYALFRWACVKMDLHKWKEADELFQVYINHLNTIKKPLSAKILSCVAYVKVMLGAEHYSEAYNFYQQALSLIEKGLEEVSEDTRQRLSTVKNKLDFLRN